MDATAFFVNSSNVSLPCPTAITRSNHFNNEEIAVMAMVCVLFGFLGVTENIAVICFICRIDGYLDAASNIFLISLAVADFLYCAIPLPMFLYSTFQGSFLGSNPHGIGAVFALSTVGSIFLLTSDRVMFVLFSLRYAAIMTVRRAAVMVTVLWIIVIGFGVVSVGFKSIEDNPAKYLVVALILASSVMQIYLFCKSRQHQAAIQGQVHAVLGQTRAIQKDFHAMKTIVMITGTFILGWLPVALSLIFVDREHNPREFYRAFVFTIPLTFVNASLDPVIHVFRRKEFRCSLQRAKQRFIQNWSHRVPPVFLQMLCFSCSTRVEAV